MDWGCGSFLLLLTSFCVYLTLCVRMQEIRELDTKGLVLLYVSELGLEVSVSVFDGSCGWFLPVTGSFQ